MRYAATSIRSEQSIARLFSDDSACELAYLIESFESPFHHRNGFSISLSVEAGKGSVAYFSRVQGAELTWECNITAIRLRREISVLERRGLWEINDFIPSVQLMDGTCLIVRAIDRDRDLSVDACLMNSDYAMSSLLRSFHCAAFRLLNRNRDYFAHSSNTWWGRFSR